jgi:hypothetical protein
MEKEMTKMKEHSKKLKKAALDVWTQFDKIFDIFKET